MKNLIKDRIEALMIEKKLSQAEIARKLGIGNNATISRILSGQTKPSYDVLDRILKNFPEINAAWLMKGEGDMFAKEQTSNCAELDEIRKELKEIQKLNNDLVRQSMEMNRRNNDLVAQLLESNKQLLVTRNSDGKKKEQNQED